MSNLVPDGWRISTVDDFAKTSAGGTPSTQKREYWDNGTIPWMSSGEVHKKRVHHVDQFISELGFKNSSAKLFPPKTILIALAGQGKTRGTVAISEIELTTNQSIAAVIIKDKSVSPDYVFFNLGSRYEELRNVSGGSGRAGLNLSIIGEQEVLLPPLPEQQKIAIILSSVDDVIEKTRAQIEKLKDLKTGMMQELLTKGIGHTEFKDSPAGWYVKKIDDLVVKVGSGITPRGGSASYVKVGIPFIRSQNVHSDGLRLDDVSYITNDQHQKMAGSQLKPNDVLLNITGASIGRCYYLPSDFKEANVNQHVCIIRVKNTTVHPVFLTLFLNSEFGQKQIMSLQAGGNREGLNFQQIRSITLPLPPIQEQERIAKITSSIETNISNKSKKLSRLQSIKKALMQDLLTGKVRVKLTDLDTEAAS